MADVYIYFVPMPAGMREYVAPCADGHTIYINEDLDEIQRAEAYSHALDHVVNNDFDRVNVQQIEAAIHKRG